MIDFFSRLTEGRIRILHVTGMETPVTSFSRIYRLKFILKFTLMCSQHVSWTSTTFIVCLVVWLKHSPPRSCQGQREERLPSRPARVQRSVRGQQVISQRSARGRSSWSVTDSRLTLVEYSFGHPIFTSIAATSFSLDDKHIDSSLTGRVQQSIMGYKMTHSLPKLFGLL